MRSKEQKSFSRSQSREASDKEDIRNGETKREKCYKVSVAAKPEWLEKLRRKNNLEEVVDNMKEKQISELVSNLQQKEERNKKTKEDKSFSIENLKTKGLISKLQDKKQMDEKEEKQKEREIDKRRVNRPKASKVEERLTQINDKRIKESNQRNPEIDEEYKNKNVTDSPNNISNERGNNNQREFNNYLINESCTSDDDQSVKTEDDEYDEDGYLDSDTGSVMFDDLLEQVRNDDPELTELNINNSDIIKTDTLIQFAEGLCSNTHIKTFSLANTRADDHVAFAIAETLWNNKSLSEINLDSNHLTSKGILAIIESLQHNATLKELRFHNQRHICGGKTEMEITKILRDNTSLIKLGYHFELAGPRMTMTNILSRNMDLQRRRRLEAQRLSNQECQCLSSPLSEEKNKPKASLQSIVVGKKEIANVFKHNNPKETQRSNTFKSTADISSSEAKSKHGSIVSDSNPGPSPPLNPPPPPAPLLDVKALLRSLTPVSQRKQDTSKVSGHGTEKSSRDQLMDSIKNCNMNALKKVKN